MEDPAVYKRIAERIFAAHREYAHQTEVILRFDDEAVLRMDRREFRQHVSKELNAAGDALMAAWDQLHGEEQR